MYKSQEIIKFDNWSTNFILLHLRGSKNLVFFVLHAESI